MPALLSTACTVISYQPPSAGEVARLRLVSAESVETQVTVLPEAQGECISSNTKQWQWLAILGAHLPRGGLRGVRIGVPGGESFESASIAETTIPAGRMFSMNLTRAGYNYICSVAVEFVPRAGVDYEAVFSQRGGQCHVGVATLKKNDDGSVARSPITVYRVHFCES